VKSSQRHDQVLHLPPTEESQGDAAIFLRRSPEMMCADCSNCIDIV
jgi:hypothetical protein